MKTTLIVPVDLALANGFVQALHRHHGKVVGHKFSIGVICPQLGPNLAGVAIVSRPVSRALDDDWTLEVTRCCVREGFPNAASALYGACCRVSFALGYRRVVTYTLKSERGTSLRASGWRVVGEVKGRSWNCVSRPRIDKSPLLDKLRWERTA